MPKHKILIIDYEPRGIKQLAEPLSEAGFNIEVATDGLKGIEAFNTIKPDLTLIEAMLPKRHGFEVCQELKKTPHGIRTPIVIVTSVYKGRKYRSQAIHHHGCDEYLEKPIPASQLVETVNRLLAGRPPQATDPVEIEAEPPGEDGVDTGAAEREIMERLDSILPGDEGNGGPSASISHDTAGDENVVSFDLERARRRRDDRAQSPSGASAATDGGAPATATAETVPHPPVAPASPVPASAAKPHAPPRAAARPAVAVRPSPPKAERGLSFWILVVLLGALGVTLIKMFL